MQLMNCLLFLCLNPMSLLLAPIGCVFLELHIPLTFTQVTADGVAVTGSVHIMARLLVNAIRHITHSCGPYLQASTSTIPASPPPPPLPVEKAKIPRRSDQNTLYIYIAVGTPLSVLFNSHLVSCTPPLPLSQYMSQKKPHPRHIVTGEACHNY